LLFASRIEDASSYQQDDVAKYMAFYSDGSYAGVHQFGGNDEGRGSVELYSTELQQIWEQPDHTTVVGGRFEWGQMRDRDYLTSYDVWAAGYLPITYQDPLYLQQDTQYDYRHFSAYGYHTWQLVDSFAVAGGLTYDFQHEPVVVGTFPSPTNMMKTVTQLSPKLGVIWTPASDTTVRAAYSRSLSDFASEGRLRLEPTSVAGFNQAYRSLIPDYTGDSSGSQLNTVELSLEQKFDTGTYLGLTAEVLLADDHSAMGAVLFDGDSPLDYPYYAWGLPEFRSYRENNLTFTVDQLVGQQWTVGARYRVSQAKLDVRYVDTFDNTQPNNQGYTDLPPQDLESVLHTLTLHANWNHPSGLFSTFEANYYHQSNYGFSPAEPGDDFWQFNVTGGYRFWHRRAELSVGLLNLFDQNYSLEPLNLYNEMARSRTFMARFVFSF
jgi:hypothetical protein